ncbi:AAA family ATPase [Corynebacterium sp. TAE3-ERU12]|nr:AAA family ATPase [Corynebacterium sp. TAE3-ERU12]MBV7296132.1 AAA family ATPase [Corynebacterium sp. TAE3-ERU12]
MLDRIYAHLDAERVRDERSLRAVQLDDDPLPQARVEREVEYHRLQQRLEQLRAAEVGLVFGRIDIDDEDPDNPVPGAEQQDRRYIGRLGLSDAEDDYRSVLMDWRAPQARAFYLATTAHPEGVSLRRHVRTRSRRVRALDDEWLQAPDGARCRPESSPDSGVGGEAVLREVLDSARTGQMRGIVETIQREQDLVIRDQTQQTMVVQGGPGTGKTAVALHRVAWLLYTHRARLEKTGVLILGPNPEFLDYISRVLPSLGETGVVLSTIADLYPGVQGRGVESLLTQEVKGSVAMVDILRQAVRDRQLVPDEPIALTWDQLTIRITPKMVKAARTRARRSQKPHNIARPVFREHLIESVAQDIAAQIGSDPLGGENLLSATDIADLRDELAEEPAVSEVLDELWPLLTPQQVLADLFSDEDRIAAAAYEYDEETQEALFRADGAMFGPSDPPLLDELADVLGDTGGDADEENRQQWLAQIEEAQDALDVLTGSASQDLDDGFAPEILMAYDLIDAEALAERQQHREHRTTAQRAASDMRWAFGHVVVDEAQELSAMAWRMVRRRSPNGWMTVVGDIAQTSSPAGAESWADALEPILASRWRVHEMTVNYRTPAEVMAVAARVLAKISPDIVAPRSIRSTGQPVRRLAGAVTDSAELARRADDVADQLRATHPDRLVEVISPQTVTACKGLEFDHVVVVHPDAIADASPQGLQDLYVAMTRATQSLTIIGPATVLDEEN